MHRYILSTLILLLFSTLCPAAERVALVIGNNAYTHAKPLANPVRDAETIGAQLKAGGWKVTPVTDAGVLAMRKAVREFCEAAKGADAAMVFYAGHGIEVKGKNYLLPVDAKLSDEAGEDALPLETMGLDELLKSLGGSGARLKIVVLDSCRNNPLSRSWLSGRSSGGGLAEVGEKAMAEGTMLVFSTAPGEVASDGVGRNSPFTTALSARMGKGGAVSDIFVDTSLAMGAQQEAWIRFDGSGRSLAAFRAFPLFPGDAVPAVPLVPSAPSGDDFMLFAGKVAGERKLVEVAPGVSIPFRWCPAGSFTMGSPAEEQALAKKWEVDASDEEEHLVTLSKGFWLAETEVTQGQWQAVMKKTLLEQAKHALEDDTVYDSLGKKTYRDYLGKKKTDDPETIAPAQGEQLPMYLVNHEEAEEWCAAASREAGVRGWRIALPTEAQWEYACRAGKGSGMSYAGDFEIEGKCDAPGLDSIAWYGGNSNQGYSGKGWSVANFPEKQYSGDTAGPRRVGQKAANEWGLRDMIGNVWEWCGDWYGAYPEGRVRDPSGASTGAYPVFRGGSWRDFAGGCRAAVRCFSEPGNRDRALGFRPALVPSR
jgi:formylglycine-generating enzyme required for sulfatase activity